MRLLSLRKFIQDLVEVGLSGSCVMEKGPNLLISKYRWFDTTKGERTKEGNDWALTIRGRAKQSVQHSPCPSISAQPISLLDKTRWGGHEMMNMCHGDLSNVFSLHP